VESAGLHGLSRISPRGGEGNTARTRTPQVTAFGSMLKAGVASLDVGAPVGRWNRMTLGDGSLLSGALPEHSVWMVPLGTSLLRPAPGRNKLRNRGGTARPLAARRAWACQWSGICRRSARAVPNAGARTT
jgi:hypothetical protein